MFIAYFVDDSASDHGSISESEDEGAGDAQAQNGVPASAQSSDYSYSDSDEEPTANHKPAAVRKVSTVWCGVPWYSLSCSVY